MSRVRPLATWAVVCVLLAGCGGADPEPPRTARVDAPAPPAPEPPAAAGSAPAPAPPASQPEAAATERPATPAPAAPANQPEPREVAAEPEPAPAAQPAPQATAAAPEPAAAEEAEIPEEVRQLMRRVVRRQRTRLWELKQQPTRLSEAGQWNVVTLAADQLAEAADKLEPLAPADGQVWKDSVARLRRGTEVLRKAAGDKSVNHFQGAVQTTWRACNNCHAKYAPEAPMNKLEYARASVNR